MPASTRSSRSPPYLTTSRTAPRAYHVGCVSRRSVVWLLTLPLAIVGSQLAHTLAYRLVTPTEAERAHELAATGHAYLAYAPAVLAVCSVLA